MSQQLQKDQWIVVGKPKRKQIKKQQKVERKIKQGKITWQAGKPLYLIQNTEADLEQFMISVSFNTNTKIIRSKIQEKFKKISSIHIQCLGLGDFMKFAKPRYQFIFLKHLLIPICSSLCQNSVSINSYDPIFSPGCIDQVKKLGSCLEDNIPLQKQNMLIILYMPHCERFLYERYCQVYEKGQVLVIGNSIKQYKNRCQMIKQQIPECFLGRHYAQTKLIDFKQSINDTYCYYI